MIVSRIALLGFVLGAPAVGWAQDPPRNLTETPWESTTRAGATTSPWQDYFRHLAGEYRMTVGEKEEPLTLVDKPLLKWSQPVRGGQDGAVYLWLEQGRPAAMSTFFIWPKDEGLMGVAHELHRLTDAELRGQWRDRIRWQPAKDPIAWQSVPRAAAADRDSARRASQAREIVRRYAATSVNRDNQKSELRLQPRPFFQYDSTDKAPPWSGGALFSLAHGTNTEVAIWLEARRGEDSLAWHYACARMSDLMLHVTLDGKEVWSTELARYDQLDAPYLSLTPEYLRQPPKRAAHQDSKQVDASP